MVRCAASRRALCDEIAVDYISHTSTVVTRAALVRDLRFDPDLRSAGEDRMFWLDLGARRGAHRDLLAVQRDLRQWREPVLLGL
jgi:hypothetical protein